MTKTVKVLVKRGASAGNRASVHLYDEGNCWAWCNRWIHAQKVQSGEWVVEEMTRAEWDGLSCNDEHDGACRNCNKILGSRERPADVARPSLQNRPFAMWREGYSDLENYKAMTGTEYTGDVLIGTLTVPAEQVREVVEARNEEAQQ